MIAIAISATTIPPSTSSQKWLPVAITVNQTHAGQTIQTALRIRLRHSPASVIPTMSASAACRLGIAAYGLAASCTSPLPWLRPPSCESESAKPASGNIRGGAVGMRM